MLLVKRLGAFFCHKNEGYYITIIRANFVERNCNIFFILEGNHLANQPYSYPRQNTYGYQPYYWGGQGGGQAPTTPPVQTGTMFPTSPTQQIPGMLPLEQSYIENIFRLNKGKLVTVYAMFDTVSAEGPRAQTFKGVVEAAGRDHLILSDPETGRRILLPMVYFGYAVFDEELDYEYPFGVPGATTYPPR